MMMIANINNTLRKRFGLRRKRLNEPLCLRSNDSENGAAGPLLTYIPPQENKPKSGFALLFHRPDRKRPWLTHCAHRYRHRLLLLQLMTKTRSTNTAGSRRFMTSKERLTRPRTMAAIMSKGLLLLLPRVW